MDIRIEQLLADGRYVAENHPNCADWYLPVDPVPAGEPYLYIGSYIQELDMLQVNTPVPGRPAKWLLVISPDSTRRVSPIYVVTQAGQFRRAALDTHWNVTLHEVPDDVIDEVVALFHRARDFV